MTARNDITGDSIQTRTTTDAYRDNYERIFGKKDKKVEQKADEKPQEPNESEGGTLD